MLITLTIISNLNVEWHKDCVGFFPRTSAIYIYVEQHKVQKGWVKLNINV